MLGRETKKGMKKNWACFLLGTVKYRGSYIHRDVLAMNTAQATKTLFPVIFNVLLVP